LKKNLFLCLIFFLIILYIYPGTFGGIKGKVVDKDNKPLIGVKLTITNIEYTTDRREIKTNKKGEFIQIGLEPGFYQVRIEMEGFMPRVEQVRVHINEIVEKEFVLESVEQIQAPKLVPGRKESGKAGQLFQQGKYEEAAKLYEDAIAKNPEDPTYYYNLGTTYMWMNKPDQAIETFKKMIELKPDSFGAFKNLGQLYAEKKNYEEARNYYSKAAEISSEDPEVFYSLGICYWNMQDYTNALEAFKKAIKSKEDYADAHYQLGLTYLNQNKLDEALPAFEKFVQLAPDDPKVQNAINIINFLKQKK
jgi:Tfp pilus assembly protein PilF